ncbi:MAG TPA: hypothetical protein VFQ43_20960 [Nitrososphaera sp.]|nr:hypothetical protein [Nitrososphaera sp.]
MITVTQLGHSERRRQDKMFILNQIAPFLGKHDSSWFLRAGQRIALTHDG